ncbi:NUDIX domain-containing protein [Devosia albogilva]|jgi:8-oxo-dGTP pyrophosphatase MutT (NUDIX family)|uniref:NUDIX domain-containing protein n=1 Tax=Devosia albogilva TaxID=429726 RepID=A0ABW5QH94_9HYPH
MMNRFQKVRAWGFLALKGWWQRMTIGARVMLVDGDKVLLIRHGYVPGWQFPGGGVGPGETVEAAAEREVLEETGYRITGPMELLGIYHQNNAVTNRDHVAFFVARQFEKVREHKPNHEIAEIGWFERTRLPEMVTPATSQRVDEVFDGVKRRTEWGY